MYGSDECDRELLLAILKLEPLRKTNMPVAPCMEKALGYRGFRRVVAFKVAEPGLIYWMDGIDDGLAEVSLLDRILTHHSSRHTSVPVVSKAEPLSRRN